MFYIVAAILIFAFIHEKNTESESEEVGRSKNFHMSRGMSKKMYNQMRKDEVSDNELKNFVQWEDRFLQVERNSVCSGVPRFIDAIAISDLIKRSFPKYDFSYHTIHLKQAAEPDKIINKSIKCQ